VYEPPREPLVEQQLETAYADVRLALIEQRLAEEEQGLHLEKLSRYWLA
jgi:hypothetical protein